MKIASKITRTSYLSKYKPLGLSPRPRRSTAYAIEQYSKNVGNSFAREVSMILKRSKNKLSRFLLCWATRSPNSVYVWRIRTYESPFLSKLEKLFQKRDKSFKSFYFTVRSDYERFSRGNRSFRLWNKFNRRGNHRDVWGRRFEAVAGRTTEIFSFIIKYNKSQAWQ